MSPNKAKNLFRNLLTSPTHLHLGCGCGPTQPIISDVFQPKPKTKPKSNSPSSPNGSSSTTTTRTSKTASYWKMEESVAVVKETLDPYEEFRQSILQMIFEKQIFSPEDLHLLLCCFLRLNSSSHHDVILRAFFDACNDVVSHSPSSSSSSTKEGR